MTLDEIEKQAACNVADMYWDQYRIPVDQARVDPEYAAHVKAEVSRLIERERRLDGTNHRGYR